MIGSVHCPFPFHIQAVSSGSFCRSFWQLSHFFLENDTIKYK